MSAISLSTDLKRDIFNLLVREELLLSILDDETLVFIGKVWDIMNMPSQDDRFKNAYEDIHQHIVRNSDWTLEYLFINRLNLLQSDEIFVRFIENLVHPDIQQSFSDINKFVFLVNPLLEKEDYILVIDDYAYGIDKSEKNKLPVYLIKHISEEESTIHTLPTNKIPFFVVKEPNGNSRHFGSHNKPKTVPSFVLVFNDGWNDYGIKSEFSLYYYDSESNHEYVGETKILYKEENNTSNFIEEEFYLLNDSFCSLGQKPVFYRRLKHLFEDSLFKSVLYALRDTAFFSEIHDKFENNDNFHTSLLRTDIAERNLRSARYQVYEIEESLLYSFNYSFKADYSKYSTEISFDFSNENHLASNRICAIIGKNGVGKTRLITTLPTSISKEDISKFSAGRIPLFSRVISVSYSVFDNFDIPKKTDLFNYKYCGLRNENGDRLSNHALVLRFHRTCKKIEESERTKEWRKILINFIDHEILDEFIHPVIDTGRVIKYSIDVKGFSSAKQKLSSGQSILLYILTEIVAHIRYDTLLLYDEPETHLHPNAITQLMNTIYELVDEFQSYCIIATHSPLVIQELLARNVNIMERHENTLSIRKIRRESFGENLSVLTEEVFGNKEIPKQFVTVVQGLVKQGKNYDEIVQVLSNGMFPINLNTRLLIQSLLPS